VLIIGDWPSRAKQAGPSYFRSRWASAQRRTLLHEKPARIRYNFLEKRALEQNLVREFVFSSGNTSGQDLAATLERALPKIRSLCRQLEPPFVASITRTGEVHLRWPKD
jgi:hypothetical protein